MFGPGLAPDAAARAAVAEVGEPALVAGAFTRASPARRTARLLLMTGPMVGYLAEVRAQLTGETAPRCRSLELTRTLRPGAASGSGSCPRTALEPLGGPRRRCARILASLAHLIQR